MRNYTAPLSNVPDEVIIQVNIWFHTYCTGSKDSRPTQPIRRCVCHKVKSQYGYHFPPGGALDIPIFPLFFSELGDVDIYWQVDDKIKLCP